MIKKFLLFLFFIGVSTERDVWMKLARGPPKCAARMFTIQSGAIQVESQMVRVKYRLGVGDSWDLVNYSPMDYANECLQWVIFRATSRSTGRVTIENHVVRDTDDVANLQKELFNLDALSTYDIQIGYQMKIPNSEQVFVDQRTVNTCFGTPSHPLDLTLKLFYNASYLIEWKDPLTVLNSPPICYYIVSIKYVNSVVPIETEVNEKFFYLRKEESQTSLTLSVFSVNDIRCLIGSYPLINNCVHQKLRSPTGASYMINPGIDYTIRAAGDNLKFSTLLYFTSTLILQYFLQINL